MTVMHDWKVGFVGLGQMGSRMARRIRESGRQITVYDKNREACSAFPNPANSVSDLVKRSNIIITMLPTGKDVESILLGEGILTSGIGQHKYFVNCSTVNPTCDRKLSQAARLNGAVYFDAPVSGGTIGAHNGTLTFMIGGPKEQVANIEPILMSMGKKAIYCGEIGSGQVAKICNNMVLGGSAVILSEAIRLAQSHGLDPMKFMDVVNVSSGRSWFSENNCPVPGYDENAPSSRDFKPGFSMELLIKDLSLAQEMARSSSVVNRVTESAMETYLTASEKSKKLDFSAIFLTLMDNYGKK